MFVTPKVSGRPSLTGQSFLSSSIPAGRNTTPRSTSSTAKRPSRNEQLLEETREHVVTAVNSPVPVQVQETLRSSREELSVRLDTSGWAWLLLGVDCCYGDTLTHCMQLVLPPSEAGSRWSSDLVAIPTRTEENKLPVLVSSPEGKLLYWPNVLRDTSNPVEDFIHLGESLSFSLSFLSHSVGYVLSISQAGLFVVSPLSHSQLCIREVQIPRGMLSGFGRRFSSLFFGASSEEVQETRRVVCDTAGESSKREEFSMFVLTNTHLQQWRLNKSGEEMSNNVDLHPLVKDAILQEEWVESSTMTNQITVFLVDMQLVGDLSAILFAYVVGSSTSAEYGIALLSIGSTDGSIPKVKRLLQLNYTTTYHIDNAESALLKYALHGSSRTLIVYNRHTALLVNLDKSAHSGLPDMVNFPQPNSILGRGHTPSALLLFTMQQGVVSVSSSRPTTSNKSVKATPTLLSSSLLTTPTYKQSPLVRPKNVLAPEASEEAVDMIKQAFENYLEGNMALVESICEEHFPLVSFASGLDTLGDLAVARLSNLILDDPPPTSDPSWNDGADPSSTPGGKSLILIYRLEQKLLAHNRYHQFLEESGLIARLTSLTVRGRVLNTMSVLCEHVEKVQAAMSVRRIHNQFTEQVIRVTVRGRSSSSLSKVEQFYTQLSCFENLLPAILVHQNESLPSLHSSRDRVELVLSSASLLYTVLRDAILYRQSMSHKYQAKATGTSQDHTHTPWVKGMPWTATDEVRRVLKEQIDLLFSVCTGEEQDEPNVWIHIVSIADILLNEFKVQIESCMKISPESGHSADIVRVFESYKREILSSLVVAKQYQHATELAERYEDFQVLVQLCEETGNHGKLAEYMQKYKTQGFSEFLFKWYLDKGQLEQLLSLSDRFPQELASFLKPHPQLSWLHSLCVRDYEQAHRALNTMADKEVRYVAKRKTLLSLSKLSLLASHGEDGVKHESLAKLDHDLQCIYFQQNIPVEAIEQSGMDFDLMPPLSPRRVVELYISEDNESANESNYVNALECINHFFPDRDSPESVDLRCYVWSQAVVRDDWTQLNTDDPLRELQKTFFSAIAHEVHSRGLDILSLLPDLTSLLSCRGLLDRGLSSSPVFQFLARAAYEQFSRIRASEVSSEH